MDAKEVSELKSQLETTGKQIDFKITEINAKAEAGENVAKEALGEVKKLVQSYGEQQKHIDELALAIERHKGGQPLVGEQKMPVDMIREALEGSADFKGVRAKGKGKAYLEFPQLTSKNLEEKAVMITSVNAPGTIIQPYYAPGIITPPTRRTTILDLLTTVPTTSNAVTYLRESGYTSNAAYVAEGQLKPEDDLTFAQITAPVETLATTLRVSKQLLEDMPMLAGYISARAPQKLRLVKELNVIYGSGANGQLQGIAPLASAFAADASLIIPTPNNYDVLGAAVLQAQLAEYFPNGIVIHPIDEFQMLHAKDSQGRYLFPEMRTGYIGSVPYATSTLAPLKGKFLVGSFDLGAQLYQREGLAIEFFDQDRDNVPRNLITIRIEERHALAVERPESFVYGDFATAKADLAA